MSMRARVRRRFSRGPLFGLMGAELTMLAVFCSAILLGVLVEVLKRTVGSFHWNGPKTANELIAQ